MQALRLPHFEVIPMPIYLYGTRVRSARLHPPHCGTAAASNGFSRLKCGTVYSL